MSPEDWKSLGEIVTYTVTGVIGTITTQKLRTKILGAPPSGPDETGSAMLSAIDAVGEKIDRLARNVGGMKIQIDGLHQDAQQNGHDISRINTRLGEVVGRVDILEQRIHRTT